MPALGSLLEFRCALITGASSGLGLEYARQLAPCAETLILVARREQLLEEIATDLVASFPNPPILFETRGETVSSILCHKQVCVLIYSLITLVWETTENFGRLIGPRSGK